ncbi:MAG: hypothetical protein KBS60_07155 [Phascolarctobacterium sp.]|nr:hypothetical protein [Candidatus Phascolarctobacterium caballi]
MTGVVAGAGGTTTVTGAVTNTSGKTITQKALTINSGASLSTDISKLTIGTVNSTRSSSTNITNNGTFTWTAGSVLKNNIAGTGTTVINGANVNADGHKITQKALTITTGALTTTGELLVISDGVITNNANLILNSGTLKQSLNSTTGTFTVNGSVKAEKQINNRTVINTGKQLTVDADLINNTVTDNGTIALTGVNKTLNASGSISGAGLILVDGTVTSNAMLNATAGIKIKDADDSLTISASNVGVDVTNGGKIILTGGVLNRNISGDIASATGKTIITGNVTFNTAINDKIEVKETGILVINANNINADIIGTHTDSGNSLVTLTGGTLDKFITKGNIAVNAGALVTLGTTGLTTGTGLKENENVIINDGGTLLVNSHTQLGKNMEVRGTLDLRDSSPNTYDGNREYVIGSGTSGNLIGGAGATIHFDLLNKAENDHAMLNGHFAVSGEAEYSSASDDGYISFDEHDSIVVNGEVSGHFNLGSVNMNGAIYMYQTGDQFYVTGGSVLLLNDPASVYSGGAWGTVGQGGAVVRNEGDLEFDTIKLFTKADGSNAAVGSDGLIIEKTTTKYGSFAYTFEQNGTNSTEIKITAEPSELTLREVINGISMNGVQQTDEVTTTFSQERLGAAFDNGDTNIKREGDPGSYIYSFVTEPEDPTLPAYDKYRNYGDTLGKQVRMAKQAATFNNYSFERDATLLKPYETYKRLYNAAVGSGNITIASGVAKFADYNAVLTYMANKSDTDVNNAMAQYLGGTVTEDVVRTVLGSMLVKTKDTLDYLLKDLDPDKTLYDYYTSDGKASSAPIWNGNPTALISEDPNNYFYKLGADAALTAYDFEIENYGLGTLTPSQSRSSRILTLNGNGHILEGGATVNTLLNGGTFAPGFAGVILSNKKDELHIVNVSEVRGFKDYVVNNKGTLFLEDTAALKLAANIKDESGSSKTGMTKIVNSKLDLVDGYKIDQAYIDVSLGSEVTATVGENKGLITSSATNNLGTIRLTGGTAANDNGAVVLQTSIIGNTGLLYIGNGTNNSYIKAEQGTIIANNIIVANGSKFAINASDIAGGSVDNHGTLILGEGVLGYDINDSADPKTGKTVIDGNIFADTSFIRQKNMEINANKTLNITADRLLIDEKINNKGTLQLIGENMVFNSAVDNNGLTIIDGTITGLKTIDGKIQIRNSRESLTIDVDLLGSSGTVDNGGLVRLTGDLTDNDVPDDKIDTLRKVINGGNIEIVSNPDKNIVITSNVDNLKGKVINATEQLTLTGGDVSNYGELTVEIAGAGVTQIGTAPGNSSYITIGTGGLINNKVQVVEGSVLKTAGENLSTNSVKNDGTIIFTEGEIGYNINSYNNGAAVANNFKGKVEIAGDVVIQSSHTINQKDLQIDVGANLTTNAISLNLMKAEGEYSPVLNNGKVTVTGGILKNAFINDISEVTGGTVPAEAVTGELHIEGNVFDGVTEVTAGTYTQSGMTIAPIYNDIYISKNDTLTLNALVLQGDVKDNAGTLKIIATEELFGSLPETEQNMIRSLKGLPVSKSILGSGEIIVNNSATAGTAAGSDPLILIDIAPIQAGKITIEKGSFAAAPALMQIGTGGIVNHGQIVFIGLTNDEAAQYQYAGLLPSTGDIVDLVTRQQTVSTNILGDDGQLVIGMGKNGSDIFLDGEVSQDIAIYGGKLSIDPDNMIKPANMSPDSRYEAQVTLVPRNIDLNGNVIAIGSDYNDTSTIIVPEGKGGTFKQMVGGQGLVEINADVSMGLGSGFVPVAYINIDELSLSGGTAGTYFVTQGTSTPTMTSAVLAAEAKATMDGFNPEAEANQHYATDTGLSDPIDLRKQNMVRAYQALKAANADLAAKKAALDLKKNAGRDYSNELENYKDSYNAMRTAAGQYGIFTSIPVSGIDVKLNAELNIAAANLKGGALQSLYLGENAHLNMIDNTAGTLVVGTGVAAMKESTPISLFAEEGSRLSLDILNDTQLDNFIVLGEASGTISLATLNLKSELMPEETLESSGSGYATRYYDLQIKDTDDDFNIIGTTTAYGDYVYIIDYVEHGTHSDHKKELRIKKMWGYTLPQIIQANKDGNYTLNAAQISTYSFTENAVNTDHVLVRGGDLGTFRGAEYRVVSDSTSETDMKDNYIRFTEAKEINPNVRVGDVLYVDRNFTINGNDTTLNGGGYQGMTINNAHGTNNSLIITDISDLSNFKDGVLGTNNAKLNITGIEGTSLNATINGNGNTVISTDVTFGEYGYFTSKVTDFKGQAFKVNRNGKYVDSKGEELEDQSIANVRVKGVLEKYTTETVEGKKQAIPGWYVGSQFYRLDEAVQNAFANFQRTGSTVYNVADGITVTIFVPKIEQNSLTINSGSLTVNANQLSIGTTITADGNLILTDGILMQAVDGKGIVRIDGDVLTETGEVMTTGHVVINETIGNKMEVKTNNTLTINADNIKNTVTNGGTLELIGGELTNYVNAEKDADGTEIPGSSIVVNGGVKANADYLGNDILIKANKTLALTNGDINRDITGEADSTLAIAGAVEDEVTVNNNGRITGIGKLQINSGNTFVTDLNDLQLGANGSVTNNGVFDINGSGDIKNKIDGSGELNLSGSFVLEKGTAITQGIINIVTGTSKLEGFADDINSYSADIPLALNNAGELYLKSDSENTTIKNTDIKGYKDATGILTVGTTVIDGPIKSKRRIENTIIVNNADSKLTIDAANVGGSVTDNGILVLTGGSTTESVLEHSVDVGLFNSGLLEVSNGSVANLDSNALRVTDLQIDQNGIFTVNMNDLTVTSDSFTNNGSLRLAGGVVKNVINGTGTTYVVNNTDFDNKVNTKVIVESGATLTTNPDDIGNGIILNSVYTPADGLNKGPVTITEYATVLVDNGGEFNSVISGVGKVIINNDIVMGSGSGFDYNYAVKLESLAHKHSQTASSGTIDEYMDKSSFERKVSSYIRDHSVEFGAECVRLAGIMRLNADDPIVVAAATKEFAALYSQEKHIVPMSTLDLDLNARLSISDAGISGGGIGALHLGSNGYLDFANGKAGNLIVNSFKADAGSQLSLDVVNDDEMDGFVVIGNAQGSLKLKNVNVLDELIKGKTIDVLSKTSAGGVKTEIYKIKDGENFVYYNPDGTEYFGSRDGFDSTQKYYGISNKQNSGDYVFTFYDVNGYTTDDMTQRVVVDEGSENLNLVSWQDLPIYGNDTLTIDGTRTASGKYLYTFSYEYNSEQNDKMLKVVKTKGFSMRQVVQGDIRPATPMSEEIRAATINTYSFNEDAYNVDKVAYKYYGAVVGTDDINGGNLGTLTGDDNMDHFQDNNGEGNSGRNLPWSNGGSDTVVSRELTINGNGHSLNGMGWKGVTVGAGDSLVLSNIKEVSNFADGIVAVNNGEFSLESGNMLVKAGLNGTGTLKVNGANVTVYNNADATNLNGYFTKGITTMVIEVDAEGNPVLEDGKPKITYKTYQNESYPINETDFDPETDGSIKLYTPQIQQSELDIVKGSMTASGYALDIATINNSGTLTLIDNFNYDDYIGTPDSVDTDNTLTGRVNNHIGKLIVDAVDIKANNVIENIITINAGKKLTIDAANIHNNVTINGTGENAGNLVLLSAADGSRFGTDTEAYSIKGGNVFVGSAGTTALVKMNAIQLVDNNLIAIAENSTLQFTGGALGQKVGDNDHYTGTLEFSGDVIVGGNAEIWTYMKVDPGVEVSILTDNFKNTDVVPPVLTTVTNEGTIRITGGDSALSKKIFGTDNGTDINAGTLIIDANVKSNADYIASATNTVTEGHTLTLTDGAILKKVQGAGIVAVDTDNTVNVITENEGIVTAGGIKVDKGILNILVGNIGADVTATDNGTISLVGLDNNGIPGNGETDNDVLQKTITGGHIVINELNAGTSVSVTANPDNLKAGDLIVNKNNTLILGGGILTTPIEGSTGDSDTNTTFIKGNLESDVKIATKKIVIDKDNAEGAVGYSLQIAAGNVGGEITNKDSNNTYGVVTLTDVPEGTNLANLLQHKITVKTIDVNGNIIVADAAYVDGSENIVEAGKTMTLSSGTGIRPITSNGTTAINGEVTIKAAIDGLESDGENIIYNLVVNDGGILHIDADNVKANGILNGGKVYIENTGDGTADGTFNQTMGGTGGTLILNQPITLGENATFVPTSYVEVPAEGQALIGTPILPMSNISVVINNELKNEQGTASGKSGGFNNVSIGTAGYLNLINDNADVIVMQTLNANYGSRLSIDMLAPAEGSSQVQMDTFVVTGGAGGRIKIDTLNVKTDIVADINDAMINASKNVVLAQLPVFGINNLYIQGTNVNYEQYKYTLREAIITSDGKVVLVDTISAAAENLENDFFEMDEGGYATGYFDKNNIHYIKLDSENIVPGAGDELISLAKATGKEIRAFAVIKEIGFNLHQIVQGEIKGNGSEDNPYVYASDAQNYSFNGSDMVNTSEISAENFNFGSDLGMLTRKVEITGGTGYTKNDLDGYNQDDGTDIDVIPANPVGGKDLSDKNPAGRTLKLHGNGGSMYGGGNAGLTINTGDAVVVDGMPVIDNFAGGIVAANDGTVTFTGNTEVHLNGAITNGTANNGKTVIEGNVVLGDVYHNYTWTPCTYDEKDVTVSVNGQNYFLKHDDAAGSNNSGISQKFIEITETGKLTANASKLTASDSTDGIKVNGTLVLTGGTTNSIITGGTDSGETVIGTEDINAEVTVGKNIASALTITLDSTLNDTVAGRTLSGAVKNYGTLNVRPQNLTGSVINTGVLNLYQGALGIDINDTNNANGTVNVLESLSNTAEKTIYAENLNFKGTGSLTDNADHLKVQTISIGTNGSLALVGGALTGNVNGAGDDDNGELKINGIVSVQGSIDDVKVTVLHGTSGRNELDLSISGILNTTVENQDVVKGDGRSFGEKAVINNKGNISYANKAELDITGGIFKATVHNHNEYGKIVAANGVTIDAVVKDGSITGTSNQGNEYTVMNSSSDSDHYGDVEVYAGDGNKNTRDKENRLNIQGDLSGITLYGNDTDNVGEETRGNNVLTITATDTKVGDIIGGNFSFDTYEFAVTHDDVLQGKSVLSLTSQFEDFTTKTANIVINGTGLQKNDRIVLVHNEIGNAILADMGSGMNYCKLNTYASYNIAVENNNDIVLTVGGVNIENKNVLGNMTDNNRAALITGAAGGGTIGSSTEYISVVGIEAAGYAKNNKVLVADTTGTDANGAGITGTNTKVYGSVTGAKGVTEASGNQVNVYGKVLGAESVDSFVTGAYSASGKVDNNTLTIESGAEVNGKITGAQTVNGTANNNKLIFAGNGKVTDIVAAESKDGDVSNNNVTIGNTVGGTAVLTPTTDGGAINIGGAKITGSGKASISTVDFVGNVENNGATLFVGDESNKLYADKVTVQSGANIENTDSTIIFNADTLAINGTISNGTVDISAKAELGTDGVIDGSELTLGEGATLLVNNADNLLTESFVNNGAVTFKNGILTKAIDEGSGNVIVDGTLTLDEHAKIGTVGVEGNKIIVNNGSTLNTAYADNIAGTAENNGTINLTGGVLASKVTGTGVTNINEGVKSDIANVASKFVVAADKIFTVVGDNTFAAGDDGKSDFRNIEGTISGDGTTYIGDGTDEAYITTQGEITTIMSVQPKANLFAMGNDIKNDITLKKQDDKIGTLRLLGGELNNTVSGDGLLTLGDLSVAKGDIATSPLSKPTTAVIGANGVVDTNVYVPDNGVIDFRNGDLNAEGHYITVEPQGTLIAKISDLLNDDGGVYSSVGDITNKLSGNYEVTLGREFYTATEYRNMRQTLTEGDPESKMNFAIIDARLKIEENQELVAYTTPVGSSDQIGGNHEVNSNTMTARDLRPAIISTGVVDDVIEVRSAPDQVLYVPCYNDDNDNPEFVDKLEVADTKGTVVKQLTVSGLKGEVPDSENDALKVFTLIVNTGSDLTLVGDGKNIVTSKFNDFDDTTNVDHCIGADRQGGANVNIEVGKEGDTALTASVLKVGLYSENNNKRQGAKVNSIHAHDNGVFNAISSTIDAQRINIEKDGNLLASGIAEVNTDTLTLNKGNVTVADKAKVKADRFNVTGETDAESTVIGEVNAKTMEVADDVILNVGKDAAGARITTGELTGNGIIFMDPLYVNGIEEASHYAVNNWDGNSKLVVARNAVLSLGTEDYNKAVNLFNKTGKVFGSDITAAVYVNKPVRMNNVGAIYVDGGLGSLGELTTPVTELGGKVYFGNKSMLMVNGMGLNGDIAISGYTSAEVKEGSKLCLDDVKPGTYKILGNGGSITGKWDSVWGSNLLEFAVDTNITDGGSGTYYNITVTKANEIPEEYKPHQNVIQAILGDPSSKAYEWLMAATNTGFYSAQEREDHVSAMMNMAEAGGVVHGMITMQHTFEDSIFSQNGLDVRGNRVQRKPELMDTVSDKPAIGNINITEIPVAKTSEIMPEAYDEVIGLDLEKRVWASYVHSKEKVTGMNLGNGLDGKYSSEINGATVGADLWSGETSFGGIALMYADGKINGSSGASTRNKVDYYGFGVYNRKDMKDNMSVIYDFNYLYGDNDIKQDNSGKEITANPKTKTISMGFRFEKLFESGSTRFIPFAGLRYMNVNGDKYSNNLGVHYDADKMNVLSMPLGLKVLGKSIINKRWEFKPYAEAGYMFNFGDRDNKMNVSYGNGSESFGYDVMDNGSLFVKAGISGATKNVVFTLSYDYMKSSNSHNNKGNLSANFTF